MAKRSRQSEEFKREAVKLVTDQGYTLAEAARSLGLGARFAAGPLAYIAEGEIC